MKRLSDLYLFSKGIVTQDKKDGEDTIIVYPIEYLSGIDGDIDNYSKSYNNTVDSNTFDIHEITSIDAEATIEATWIGESNRDTAPDVIKNEQVRIYKAKNTEKYYWEPLYRTDKRLRRLERVRYVFSNKPDMDLTEWDDDSSYFIEYSTKDKHIWLHTSDNDGESAKYDIKIDTKSGIISLVDNQENSFYLESTKGLLTGNLRSTVLNSPKILLNGNVVITGTTKIYKTLEVRKAVNFLSSLKVLSGIKCLASIVGASVRSLSNKHLR